MTSALIKDKFGRIIEIQENGETVWNADEQVDRQKISQASRDKQKQAIKDGDTQTRIENLEEIIFGKEIHQ